MLDSLTGSSWPILNNVGITINVEAAYRTYADALSNPDDFSRGRDAIAWWERGGLRGRWRHTAIRLLKPRLYAEMREWQERGRSMKQQAFLNAVLSAAERS